ncbi:MAG: efflux RND transporter periplasmic adaptor subunit [Gammaproteobacteria bacterium]|nr:efflux RND transporter periplasmic adaptor subunit [Gammaproteobacteria bacterium]MYA67865.1 efflux RND transporter periplasmic adaptor subunit [Gammaproteobacteria bacterium]MYG96773.1 efflux RND transporter periplasmic adaptor subunit [Gammaproteobacteria bacterium]MYH45244.1 efflux RND transporter periplasmic adaptor subunit [Gammaproteobacteria bacterium]MYL12482.1 efflux RND transporter periplasmic adaptor subunit [Gammaproteobacteria bacterium]
MLRVLLPVGILAGCVLIAAWLVLNPTELDEASPEIVPVAVRVMEVRSEPTKLFVESQGKVQAARTVNLSTPVAGTVAWISPKLEAGGYVAVDEPLLRLDSSDYEIALARSEAALEQAIAEELHARSEYERLRELGERRLASESQIQNAERLANVTAARINEIETQLRQARIDLERTEVRAPFDAIVQSRQVELGQYANRAQNIAVMYGAEEVEVRLPLAIRQLGYLDVPLDFRGELDRRVAPVVRLEGLYGGQRHIWFGRMVRTEATIDPDSNTVQSIVRVTQPQEVDNEQGEKNAIPLPIGLFVEASISGREIDDIIALPRSVIRNNNQVLVVDAENKMYYREVEIFRFEEERVLISGGLAPGEIVCISPIQAVVNGMAVQPVREII